jgi:hypothetical protein
MTRQIWTTPSARTDSPVRDDEVTATDSGTTGQDEPVTERIPAFVHMPGENIDEAIDLGPVPVDSYPSPTPSVPGKRNRHDVLARGGAINDADAPMPAIRGERIERQDGPTPDPDDAHRA